MWQQWLNILAGLWIIVSAFLNFDSSAATVNFTVTGFIIAVLALWGILEHRIMQSHFIRSRRFLFRS